MMPSNLQPRKIIEQLIVWAGAFAAIVILDAGLLGSWLVVGSVYTYYKLKEKGRARPTRDWMLAYAEGLAQIIGVITAFYYLNRWLGVYGWLGLLLLCGLTAAWLLYKQRSFVLETWRTCERQLYGETMEERRARRRRE